jgi:hypothetical protein
MSGYLKRPDGIYKKVVLDGEYIVKELKIDQYLSDKKGEIFNFINKHRRVLLAANPATGKTTLFADLYVSHIKNKKKGRIIFCCPYLIIQSQFKERIESEGIEIDFELNHKAVRKKLKDFDKIITSTFNSFKHIAKQLTEDDTIIIDEAHTILKTYKDYKNNSLTYFTDFTQCLYRTNSKLILMTGTPNSALNALFNVSELKIIRKEKHAKINVQYTNERHPNLALEFAKNAMQEFDENCLNIIFVKNKSKCHQIKQLLIQHLGVEVVVMTSDEKDSDDYMSLVKESIIPNQYQFLVTTNVISTGTNILNKKVGRALMLDERDPVEIKQFCKRFRNKPDIHVQVLNPSYSEPEIDLKIEREYWTYQRDELRATYKVLLSQLNEIEEKQLDYALSKKLKFNNIDSSPYQMINLCLEQFLIQEVYFNTQITETYNSEIELVEALNDFDDILSVKVEAYSSVSTEQDIGDKEALKEYKKRLKEHFEDFQAKPEQYLNAAHNFLISVNDRYLMWKLVNTVKINSDIKILDNSIPKKVSSYYFIDNLLKPFLDYYEHFKDSEKTIHFLKTHPPNKRSTLSVSLFFNRKFHEFYVVRKGTSKVGLTRLYLESKKRATNPMDRFTIKFLRNTFEHLVRNDYVNSDDLEKFLLDSEIQLPKQLKTPLGFPYNYVTIDKVSRNVSSIQSSFILGLSKSIFKVNPKQHHPLDKNGVRKKAYYFEKDTLKVTGEEKPFIEGDIHKEIETSIVYEYNCLTSQHDRMNLGNSKRVLIKSPGLINGILGEDFYKEKVNTFLKRLSKL